MKNGNAYCWILWILITMNYLPCFLQKRYIIGPKKCRDIGHNIVGCSFCQFHYIDLSCHIQNITYNSLSELQGTSLLKLLQIQVLENLLPEETMECEKFARIFLSRKNVRRCINTTGRLRLKDNSKIIEQTTTATTTVRNDLYSLSTPWKPSFQVTPVRNLPPHPNSMHTSWNQRSFNGNKLSSELPSLQGGRARYSQSRTSRLQGMQRDPGQGSRGKLSWLNKVKNGMQNSAQTRGRSGYSFNKMASMGKKK